MNGFSSSIQYFLMQRVTSSAAFHTFDPLSNLETCKRREYASARAAP